MRRFSFVCYLLVISLIFSVASAKDFRMAIVDMQKLFNSYPGTQKAKEKLVAWAKKKQQDLAPEKQELEDLQNDLTNSSSVFSEKQKARKKKEFDDKYAAYQQEAQELEKEQMLKENEMTQTIVDQLKDLVAGVAKDKGYDLVLDKDKVVYSKDAVDLTDDIVKGFKDTDSSKDDGSKK